MKIIFEAYSQEQCKKLLFCVFLLLLLFSPFVFSYSSIPIFPSFQHIDKNFCLHQKNLKNLHLKEKESLFLTHSKCYVENNHIRMHNRLHENMDEKVEEEIEEKTKQKQQIEFNHESRPIVDTLLEMQKKIKGRFFFPGHKMGQGINQTLFNCNTSTLPGVKKNLEVKSDPSVWSMDLPELPELDNLFSPEGPIKEAQELAADAFGSRKTYFLVNGSTCGIMASIMALFRLHCIYNPLVKERYIIVPRNVHKSVINGIILTNAIPIFIDSEYDSKLNVCLGMKVRESGENLDEENEAQVREKKRSKVENTLEGCLERLKQNKLLNTIIGVLLVSPTYNGVLIDLKDAIRLCKEYNDLPVIVDEAHGSHLQFLPEYKTKYSALYCGATLVVQSTHKSLNALTQAGMLHLNKKLPKWYTEDEMTEALYSALSMYMSTSPSYILLASLDNARYMLKTEYSNSLPSIQSITMIVKEIRTKIKEETIFDVLSEEKNLNKNDNHEKKENKKFVLDPFKLCISTNDYISGFDLDDLLITRYGIYAEMPELKYLTFAFSGGNTKTEVLSLFRALKEISLETMKDVEMRLEKNTFPILKIEPLPSFPRYGKMRLSPREAYFAPSERIIITEIENMTKNGNHLRYNVEGRISAETICPYPPGIPIIMAGEEINQNCIQYLMQLIQCQKATIIGCDDPTFESIKVIKE